MGLWPGQLDVHAQPTSDPPVQTDAGNGIQLEWPENYLLDDGSGAGHWWWLKSIRIADGDEGLSLYAEAVNRSNEFVASPSLEIGFLKDGSSYGRQTLGSAVEAVPPGGSAFYQTTALYGGSLRVGDWDEQHFSLNTNRAIDPDLRVYRSLDIEGDRIQNNSATPVSEIAFIDVSRGADGIFVALCSSDDIFAALHGDGTGTGATIPAGESVRAPGLDEPRGGPDCHSAEAAVEMAEDLGVDEYRNEYVLAHMEAPWPPTQRCK
jgi:hypothetical protein